MAVHNIVLQDWEWVQCAGGKRLTVKVQVVCELLNQLVIGERMEQVVIGRQVNWRGQEVPVKDG